MGMRPRQLILGGLLAATLVATAWVHGNDDENSVVAPARSGAADATQRNATNNARAPSRSAAGNPTRESRNENASMQIHLDRLDARSLGQSTRDPFSIPVRKVARQSAKPAPVVVVAKAIAPPPPSAPALPFKYMGKLVDGDVTKVFLIQGDRNLVVREGETVDSVYRIDRITDREIVLTYLPMNQQQILNLVAQ